jgi:hypothetical protein
MTLQWGHAQATKGMIPRRKRAWLAESWQFNRHRNIVWLPIVMLRGQSRRFRRRPMPGSEEPLSRSGASRKFYSSRDKPSYKGGKREEGGMPQVLEAHVEDDLACAQRELNEAREQQAATSEILRVISGSPADVQPVFDAIAATALRLCGATWSLVARFDGELIELKSLQNVSDPSGVQAIRRAFPRPPRRGGATDRAIQTGTIAYIPDVYEDPEYPFQDLAQVPGYRSSPPSSSNALDEVSRAGD